MLNNNVVVTVDENGTERVLMGRGLGFNLQPDGSIDTGKVEKTFVLDQGTEGDRIRELFADVPYQLVRSVIGAVELAERSLGRSLGRHLVFALLDHVSFLLERLDKAISVPSAPMPALRVLYPDEYAVACKMVERVSGDLGRQLPQGEEIFFTMHLLNATRDEPDADAAQILRGVQHVVSVVEAELGVTLDADSPDYARFVLHVQFLLRRLVDRSMLTGTESSLYEVSRRSYPTAFRIAENIKAYVGEATGSELTDEEVLYLTMHVERLSRTLSSPA
ncbi:beta-glucoside operon transcriptional antiterminator [Propionibacterium cyclohexanicum]|uniref:Beta-glucoside operon transcriptional antiterminator n=1 Tax=Propionibacterium cyclohexanicum TaxID=64702 RepID=A0A1H9S0K6_9ACTN|nr:beta-glucoside operon transcriptional antiterminator [Propionibacterium cyclohexanicum]